MSFLNQCLLYSSLSLLTATLVPVVSVKTPASCLAPLFFSHCTSGHQQSLSTPPPQCCHLAQTTLISLDYYDNPSCCYSCSLLNHIPIVILYKWTHGHGVPPWLSIWVHCCPYCDLQHSPSTCPLLNLLDFTDSLVHSHRPHQPPCCSLHMPGATNSKPLLLLIFSIPSGLT